MPHPAWNLDWRRHVLAGVLAALTLAPLPAAAQPVPTDFTEIVKQKMPAVVAITTQQRVEEQEQAQWCCHVNQHRAH
jgi:serine protease Do